MKHIEAIVFISLILMGLGFWLYFDYYRTSTKEFKEQIAISNEEYLINRLQGNILYLKDINTDICFAEMTSGPHGFGFTTVDCEKLENVKLIEFSSRNTSGNN